MSENDQKEDYFNTKNAESTMKAVIVTLIICTILAVLGTGLGIYSTIQANRAISAIYGDGTNEVESTDGDEEDESTVEFTYGKPASAEEIEYVSISYNNNQDFIEIYNDEEDQSITYYTEGGEDSKSETVESGVNDVLKHIFEKDLEYLGDNDILENETWSIEVDTADKTSYISGDSAAPEWFNELLKKLDVDNKGYKSQK